MRNSLSLRFWTVLALQIVLILAVPAQAFYTQINGRSLVLQTAPVDPYSLFQGYSVTLGYDISNVQNLSKLSGWKDIEAKRKANPERDPLSLDEAASTEFYVILAAPANASNRPPKPWKAVAVVSSRPNNLPANQIALRGSDRQGRIRYGLETYFIPEDQRDDINQQINQAQGESSKPAFVVEAKVGADGNAVPIAIWLKDKRYQF
ncbi:MAG: GDYXXLXY domain-containing protein [Cyanobacteria bacterium CAN_BIN43]|nr:GDYXXLXY domain-containing protein [Cyanobacteria bacterium CAN_BIN43]